jgi:hypothetical protein
MKKDVNNINATTQTSAAQHIQRAARHKQKKEGKNIMTKSQFKHAIKMAIEEKRTYEKEVEKEISRKDFVVDINNKIEKEGGNIILHTMIH